ncbi:DUF3999 family protein [Pseudomarimonas arenosa]|uniref:DUF3999 family protein n=1 Tax=Pseudomarimonas arenosa TaxID=2774145 RepID=A0AAW3ZQA5_9GAMM|nr:DUF3999 family protein [Pseudomarimonas arenosa]MBD8527720.1 DUF3999 family protein [Pseudomarimonas arenosa]
MRRLLVSGALLAMIAAAPARAADYAWQWSLQLPSDGNTLFQLQLDESVYGASIDPLLRDIEIVDADGHPLPAMLQSPSPSRLEISESFEVRWFPLAAAPADGVAGWRAVIEGQRLTLQSQPEVDAAGEAGPLMSELLIDLGDKAQQTRAVELQLAEDQAALQSELSVQSSADLESWKTLRPPARLYRLSHRGELLQQTRIDWNSAPGRYLRLQFKAPLALAAMERVLATRIDSEVELPTLVWLSLEGRQDADGSWNYELPGAMPIRAFDLQAPGEQWLLKFDLASRPWSDAAWAQRAQGSHYRLQIEGDWLDSGDRLLAVTRDRHWRLRSDQPLSAAPVLKLAYHPDVLMFASNGASQIALLAGSRLGRRIDAPLGTALAAARSKRGGDWQPQRIELGLRLERDGIAALEHGVSPNRWLKLALWSLLVLAALSLLLMASKLLREGKAA